jgi:hypothetical protein
MEKRIANQKTVWVNSYILIFYTWKINLLASWTFYENRENDAKFMDLVPRLSK